MNVIKRATLKAFWEKHPHAEIPLKTWYKDMRSSRYEAFAQLRQTYPSADYMQDEALTIFNIGGNKYRLVTFIRYTAQTVFIKSVMTHAEYSFWNDQRRKR